jgi:hypothetical protein
MLTEQKERHTFRIAEDGITIIGRSSVGGGLLKLSDEEKLNMVAKEATVRDICTMRTCGLVAVADCVRAIQPADRRPPPILPWIRRRSPSRFAEIRGQWVVSLE